MKKKNIIGISLALLVVVNLSVYDTAIAQTEDPPPDPGATTEQDDLVSNTTRWVLPHGETFVVEDEEFNIILDYAQLIISEETVAGGTVTFVGLGDTSVIGDDGSSSSSPICGMGNGIGKCLGQKNKEIGFDAHLPDADCGDVWVTPGIVAMSSEKSGPSFPVVIGQDPDDEGVTIEYTVVVNPTVVSYEKWQIIGHHFTACVEGEASESEEDYSAEYSCPHGWHPIVEHIWGCSVREKYFREDLSQLNAGISLTYDSRIWILGDLAFAYPFANLINPSIFYPVSDKCAWTGDVCVLNFAYNFQVADPGFYDLVIQGSTTGTRASPPRSFEIKSGKTGVYLIDTSLSSIF